MRQAGYKALMEIRIVQKNLVANPKEREHLINLSVYDRCLKLILEIGGIKWGCVSSG
jgi:hypothetical protein